jgi:predicted nucleotidyltransferase
MEKLKNLDRLHPDAAKKIKSYMNELLDIHGDDIVSMFVYGSAVAGNYLKGESDINSAIVFEQIRPLVLSKSLKTVNAGIRHKINTPLFLTQKHILASLDTFPIEFLEMKENHVLVYGQNILSGIDIDPVHIGFICEQQIKGGLIRIRQAYLEIGLRKKGIEALIKESFTSLIPLFRGMLRLKGVIPSADKKENIQALGETFGIDTSVLLAILADKQHDGRISGQDLEDVLFRYIEQLEKLGDIADKLR